MGSKRANHNAGRNLFKDAFLIQTWQLMGCGVATLSITSGRGIGRAAAAQRPRQNNAAHTNQTVRMKPISIRRCELVS